jgi:hypothetical protein
MAVRISEWTGRGNIESPLDLSAHSHALSRRERVARIQRRRRVSRAQVALESAIWIAGSAVVAVIAFAGVLALR